MRKDPRMAQLNVSMSAAARLSKRCCAELAGYEDFALVCFASSASLSSSK